ncbi:MAG: lysozyme inhibitor LprI family protein [Roseibium sp.]
MIFSKSVRTCCLASLIATSASPAAAQSCEAPANTRDMITCAQMDLNLSDGDLNRTYKELKASLDKKGSNTLRKAQRAWIAFRDAECTRQADVARGGTMAPVVELECLHSLTVRRINDLSRNPLTGE